VYDSFDGCCSTVQGLLDWFEVDLGFPELVFNQIHLCTSDLDLEARSLCRFSLERCKRELETELLDRDLRRVHTQQPKGKNLGRTQNLKIAEIEC